MLCSRAPGNELVAAECEALTGSRPGSDGLAFCKTIDNVRQAAYLSTGLKLIARGSTLEALAVDISRAFFSADQFRVDCVDFYKQANVNHKTAIRTIADVIRGTPDLDFPRRKLLIIISEGGLYLGEVITEATRTYLKHDMKPYRTSSSLPSQLARLMVNLTYPARSILDPCCGTGSILLEACELGVTAYGVDNNPKMIRATSGNLLNFGYRAVVQLGDARKCNCPVDAVVTDVPYGRFLKLDDANVRAILRNMASQAPLGIFVSDKDLSPWLREAGYEQIDVFRLQKRPDMIRYVHRALISEGEHQSL